MRQNISRLICCDITIGADALKKQDFIAAYSFIYDLINLNELRYGCLIYINMNDKKKIYRRLKRYYQESMLYIIHTLKIR
jgi:hypothetical protein